MNLDASLARGDQKHHQTYHLAWFQLSEKILEALQLYIAPEFGLKYRPPWKELKLVVDNTRNK